MSHTSPFKDELEQVKEERDHWRDLAIQLEAEIGDLKRDLERKSIWESAFAGGVRAEVDKAIEQLQRERDEARQKLEVLLRVLQFESDEAHRRLVKALNDRDAKLREVHELAKKQGTPFVSKALLLMFRQLLDDYAAAMGRLKEPNGIFIPSELFFTNTLLMERCTALIDAGNLLLTLSFATAQDPRMVAYDIWRECLEGGEPRIETLQRLDLNWIKANLPQAPSKYQKLQEGLRWAHAQRKSGQSIRVFTDENQVQISSEKTIRTYLGWYKVFEMLAQEVGKLTAFLPHTGE